jgi:hypothetical protein
LALFSALVTVSTPLMIGSHILGQFLDVTWGEIAIGLRPLGGALRACALLGFRTFLV